MLDLITCKKYIMLVLKATFRHHRIQYLHLMTKKERNCLKDDCYNPILNHIIKVNGENLLPGTPSNCNTLYTGTCTCYLLREHTETYHIMPYGEHTGWNWHIIEDGCIFVESFMHKISQFLHILWDALALGGWGMAQ